MDPSLLGSGGLTRNGQPTNLVQGNAPGVANGGGMGLSNAAMASAPPAPQGGIQNPGQPIANPYPGGGANVYGIAGTGAGGQGIQTGSGPQWTTDPSMPGGGQTYQGNQTVGQFGTDQTFGQFEQGQNERFSISNDANYGDYQRLGAQAQGWGAQGLGVLNDPRQAQALQNQAALAGGPTAGQAIGLQQQQRGLAQQGQSMAMLQNAAAGNGPTAADIQSQRGVSEAMRAQLTAAASARGGAYAQSAAQQQASQNAAGIQAGAVSQAAQLRAQEQQQAMGQYSQATGQYSQAAGQLSATQNQGLAAQSQAAQAYQQGVQGNQGQALQYYQGQQQAYQHQSDIAAGLAQSQVANDLGLSGTQMQTQTQQNIANQQQSQAAIGSAVAAGGMILAAAASTGGAQAAAKGAREHGASESEAQAIGAHVGQAIGMARLGPAAHAAAPADAMAAKKGAMTRAEMVAYMHSKHDDGKRMKNLPGPKTEPMAAHAYAVGSHMAALAKMHRRAG